MDSFFKFFKCILVGNLQSFFMFSFLFNLSLHRGIIGNIIFFMDRKRGVA